MPHRFARVRARGQKFSPFSLRYIAMFKFNWFGGKQQPKATPETVEEIFLEMLRTAQREFTLASDVALAGTEAASVKEEVLAADKTINQLERDLRKALVVRSAVHGVVDPECLVMMSIAKDAERLGDYSKNIFDLGAMDLEPPAGGDKERLLVLKSSIEKLFTQTISTFVEEDLAKAKEQAKALIREAAWLAHQCEANTERLLLDEPTRRSAPDALLYRFMKRMASHLRNICSSIVQAVHKLDFTSKLLKGVNLDIDLLDGEGYLE